jgi:hypothetical protein
VKLTGEAIGVAGLEGAALDNGGYGITAEAGGHVAVVDSEIAHDLAGGIDAEDTATVGLTGSTVHDVGGPGIETVNAPAAPTIAAAIPEPNQRMWVVLTGLAPGATRTVALYANPACPGQATTSVFERDVTANSSGKALLVLTGDKAAVSFAKNLTATATDVRAGSPSTSRLSACVVPGSQPDTDGDGIPDVVEDVAGAGLAGDPTRAALPRSGSGFNLYMTDAGQLSGLTPASVDAAAPFGVSVPDLATFSITGLSPGADADVAVLTSAVGATWWRYGPATPGAEPGWYVWSYDEQTDLGAKHYADLGDKHDAQGWLLRFRDGAAGDDDGVANGTIVDPGGPADPTGAGAPGTPAIGLPAYASSATASLHLPVSWSAPGAAAYSVSVAGGPATSTSAGSTTVDVRPGTVASVTVTAANADGTSTATASTVVPRDEGVLRFHGRWKKRRSATAWLGTDRLGRAGASARLKVRGSAVTVIGSRCRKCGSLAVYVDGKLVKTLKEKGKPAVRVVLGTVKLKGKRKHVVELVVKGRPAAVDGIAIAP